MHLAKRSRAAVWSAALLATVVSGSSTTAMAQAAPAPPPGCTGTPSSTWISVIADGLRNGDGQLAVTLYADDSKRFLAKHGSLYVGRIDVEAGTTRGCIFVPDAGVYAIVLYHDQNANQKFDRNILGLPTEGYGFSNNPSTFAGLPAFRSVRLNISRTGLVTRVHMKYP